MKKNRVFCLLLLTAIIQNIYAQPIEEVKSQQNDQDPTYFLAGKTRTLVVEKPDEDSMQSSNAPYFLPEYISETAIMEDDENSILYFLPGTGKEIDPLIIQDKTYLPNPTPVEIPEFSTGKLRDETISQLPAGSKALDKPGFESMDNWERIYKLRPQAKQEFTMTVLLDNFNYGGPPGVYDALYEGSNKNFMNNFFFQGAYSYTFLKTFFHLSGGVNLGVSHKRGKGTFDDGEKSDTTIVLWALPLDLAVNLQIPFGDAFGIEASAGPSLMTLLQNRDDRDEGDAGKDTYQISPGYFAAGRIKINWGDIWKSAGLALFNTSDVTNLFLNLDVRYEFYDKFSDTQVKVDGVSYGLGLSFEFL